MVPERLCNLQLTAGRQFSAETETDNCSGTIDILIDASDPDEQLWHCVHREGVDLFSLKGTMGDLRHLESFVSEDLRLVDAALSPRSGYLYGANLDSLVILKRDPETSEFTLIDTGNNLHHLHALSISDDGKYFFALENRDRPHTITVFDLTNPEEPALEARFIDVGSGSVGFGECKVSDFRMEDMPQIFLQFEPFCNGIPSRHGRRARSY